MSKKQSALSSPVLTDILICIAAAVMGLVYFAGHYKIATLLIGLWCIYLLMTHDPSPLRSIPAMLFLTYIVVSGLTRFWAISGKFFLKEYAEIFVSAALFLGVMLCKNFDRNTVRHIMRVISGVSTVYCILSVEAATTGISDSILRSLLNYSGISTGFEVGTRLTGIIGNANVLSSIVALGIFCSICLLCREENPTEKLVYAAMYAVNAFVFLLLFSMGGTACFILSVFFYLIFAGKNRSGALVRMLECAIPTVVWVFAAFPFFNQSDGAVMVPLCAMVGNTITVMLLEKALGTRMTQALSKHNKLTLGVFAGVIALACVYIILGLSLTEAYTFSGDNLRRSAYPESGEHTLSIEASGPVNVTITSQNMSQVMMHTDTVLYHGSAENAEFIVPEYSEVCYFTFTATDGTVLEDATLDSDESLKLKYTLLPGFIANRLQGLFANQNAIQRTVFFRDGMKMFYNSPIVGNGVGSFETGITSVQEFYYVTKYIHNHYIQVLLEGGIVAFLPFIGALLGMVWLLLKRRGEDEEWEFYAEYPVLWACMVMILSHIVVELSMSIIIFVWMAYVVFALVIRCCGSVTEWEPAGKIAVRAAVAVLSGIFVLTLCCNLASTKIASSQVRSVEEYFQNLELAATLDPYEGNDAKLSYVLQTYNQDQPHLIPKANEYAAQLLKVQSNSIPIVLLQYYLFTDQYEQAFQAAQAAVTYSASDFVVWNQICAIMSRTFLDTYPSPLTHEQQGSELLDELLEFYHRLRTRNEGSMETIALDHISKDFFSRILAVEQTTLSEDAITFILWQYLFDSNAFCDADNNLIPDQITKYSGVKFNESHWNMAENSSMTLEIMSKGVDLLAEITIECGDPQSITVTDSNGTEIPGTISQNTWHGSVWQPEYGAAFSLSIQSAIPQTVSDIYVISE